MFYGFILGPGNFLLIYLLTYFLSVLVNITAGYKAIPDAFVFNATTASFVESPSPANDKLAANMTGEEEDIGASKLVTQPDSNVTWLATSAIGDVASKHATNVAPLSELQSNSARSDVVTPGEWNNIERPIDTSTDNVTG